MILDDIVARKRADMAEQTRVSLTSLEAQAARWERRDFVAAVRGGGPDMCVIAELKKATPSKGVLCEDFQPAALGRTYAEAGAAAISVLTDAPFFQGCEEDLTAVREAVAVPVLRKDFIVDPYQVAETAAIGADAVLLIVAVLDNPMLRELHAVAHGCGLSTLVEVTSEAELDRALRLDVDVVGINNRDLRTFEVRLETTLSLAPRVPKDIPVASLSGIATRRDVERVRDAGATAVLVGEALMRAPDVPALLGELRHGAREDLRHHASG